MKPSQLVALRAVYDNDPCRTRADREALLRAFGLTANGNGSEPADKLISFAEAAARLNRSPRSIHLLARRGVLRKARLPGFTRCSGVLASDLDKLLAGMGSEGGESK